MSSWLPSNYTRKRTRQEGKERAVVFIGSTVLGNCSERACTRFLTLSKCWKSLTTKTITEQPYLVILNQLYDIIKSRVERDRIIETRPSLGRHAFWSASTVEVAVKRLAARF